MKKRIFYFLFPILILLLNITIVFCATIATIQLQYDSEVIPSQSSSGGDLVDQGKVLYRVKIRASIISPTDSRRMGRTILFSSNSSVAKCLTSSGLTNSNGIVYGNFEVRGNNSFQIAARIKDGEPLSGSATVIISPEVSAYYESPFKLTYYYIADEKDYTGSYDTPMPGIDGLYKSAFVQAVKLNGSGYTHTNRYVRYIGNNRFEYGNPITASGTTPVAGRTIAVDNKYIPRYFNGSNWLRGKVDIAGGVGIRIAEDSGGAIVGYHIDVFTGVGKSSALNTPWNNTYQKVKYLGNVVQ